METLVKTVMEAACDYEAAKAPADFAASRWRNGQSGGTMNHLLLAALLILVATNSYAQSPIEGATKDARPVILKPDGTWEFKKPVPAGMIVTVCGTDHAILSVVDPRAVRCQVILRLVACWVIVNQRVIRIIGRVHAIRVWINRRLHVVDEVAVGLAGVTVNRAITPTIVLITLLPRWLRSASVLTHACQAIQRVIAVLLIPGSRVRVLIIVGNEHRLLLQIAVIVRAVTACARALITVVVY